MPQRMSDLAQKRQTMAGMVRTPQQSLSDVQYLMQRRQAEMAQPQPQTMGEVLNPMRHAIFGRLPGEDGSNPYSQDPEKRRMAYEDLTNAGLGAFGAVSVAARAAKPVLTPLQKAQAKLEKAIEKLEASYGPRSQFADRYPVTGPPTTKTFKNVNKKTGEITYREGPSKRLTPEAEAVQKVRQASQEVIDLGGYEKTFDTAKRFNVDAADYPVAQKTIEEAVPQTTSPKVLDRMMKEYQPLANNEEALGKIWDAYQKVKDDPRAHGWYFVGQLERAFRDEPGEEAGRAMFKERFADAMAATTGGQNPTDNFVMAMYGNFMKRAGLPFPENAYELPFPIGGESAMGNISQYQKFINEGVPISARENPKRHNFSANFQGHEGPIVIDKQISTPYGIDAPPGPAYGMMERPLGDLVSRAGETGSNFQGVAWHGLGGRTPKPMMDVVNESIERTHQVTGIPRDQILRRIIRATIATYGVAGAAGLGAGKTEPQPGTSTQ